MEDTFIFPFYIIISAVFLIAGIIILLTGFATDRKPLRLAGIVVAVTDFQVIAIMLFCWMMAVWSAG